MPQILRKAASGFGFVLQCYCITHCTFKYVVDLVLCNGPSMEPTIFTDDILLTEHITQGMFRVQKGDIVIALSPTNPRQQICKRITALPGDSVKVGFGRTKFIPRGHIWVEGDNKSNSCDSRTYGPIPLGLVRGRAILKIWPLKDITVLAD